MRHAIEPVSRAVTQAELDRRDGEMVRLYSESKRRIEAARPDWAAKNLAAERAAGASVRGESFDAASGVGPPKVLVAIGGVVTVGVRGDVGDAPELLRVEAERFLTDDRLDDHSGEIAGLWERVEAQEQRLLWFGEVLAEMKSLRHVQDLWG